MAKKEFLEQIEAQSKAQRDTRRLAAAALAREKTKWMTFGIKLIQ